MNIVPGANGTKRLSSADKAAMWWIFVIGVGVGAWIASMGLIQGAFRLISPGQFPITLPAYLPVEHSSVVLTATTDSVTVATDALSFGVVLLLAIGDLLRGLTFGIVVAGGCYALYRIARQQVFHYTMLRVALLTGATLAVGSLLSQGVSGIGRMLAANELEGLVSGVQPGFWMDPGLIFVGFGIIALTYVLDVGNRLKRDTEGLV